MPSGTYDRPPERVYVTWYRCIADQHAHAVTDEDFARGVRSRTGRYRARCGHEVVVDSCLAPPGRGCPACLRRVSPTPLRSRPAGSAHRPRHHRKPPALRRLLRRLHTPAGPPPRPPQRARRPPSGPAGPAFDG
jgi:hypothetical protein